jgi:hypothetical protein
MRNAQDRVQLRGVSAISVECSSTATSVYQLELYPLVKSVIVAQWPLKGVHDDN